MTQQNMHFPADSLRGTWLYYRQFKVRVFVPFEERRLDTIGLFNFRKHYHARIRKFFSSFERFSGEMPQWISVPAGPRIFVESSRRNLSQPNRRIQ